MPRFAYTSLLALLTAQLALGGCGDTTFDPFQESAFNYSIFGYLDAGADTQFVRVTTLRNNLTSAPDSIDATVTLEHLASAHKTIWKDSLFQFGQGVVGHNFWSPESLIPGHVYRLTVMRSDGVSSMASVTLPDTFPDPLIMIDRFDPNAKPVIVITGVDRLADVKMIYHVRDPRIAPSIAKVERFMFSYLQDASEFSNGFGVTVDVQRDLSIIGQSLGGVNPVVVTIETLVAAASADWPDAGLDEETLALPDVVSNIENGVGFLGGIVSKTITWPTSSSKR